MKRSGLALALAALAVLAGAAACAQAREKQVAWAQDWVPPNIGWESELAAYRAYWGQFDFFGKKTKDLVLPTLGNNAAYHQEQPWGIDALHVGETCGLGGVVLYVNGIGYPVWSPSGEGGVEWSKGLVEEANDAVTIRMEAVNVGPAETSFRVRFHCGINAGERHSRIEVTVLDGNPEAELALGIGLVRLPEEESVVEKELGIIAIAGEQESGIGPIRMAVLYDPEALLRVRKEETRQEAVVRAKHGVPVVYAIQGDWLRGRASSEPSPLEDWVQELREVSQDIWK